MKKIKCGNLNFIVSGAPGDMNKFKMQLLNYGITDVVKACDIKYSHVDISSICKIHEFVFEDGKFPSSEMTYEWIKLIHETFYIINTTDIELKSEKLMLVHCVAGLGRSPLLVCIAIIVCENKTSIEAVKLAREKMGPVLNTKQLDFLFNTNWKKYRKFFNKMKKQSLHKKRTCVIL